MRIPSRVASEHLDESTRHATARRAYVAQGEAALARGAALLHVVATYRLAASASTTAVAFAVRLGRLRDAVAHVEAERRDHVASLVDAALAAEASRRLAVGLPPHDRRIDRWMSPSPDRADAGQEDVGAEAVGPSPEAIAEHAVASDADDVDVAISRALAIGRAMVAQGGPSDAGLDALALTAFALCGKAAGSAAEGEDRRRTLVILWLALRRRRPLAAAILRAQLRRDSMARCAFIGR